MKTFLLIVSSFRDLFMRHLPQKDTPDGFAFLVHPRNIEDIERRYPFIKFLPKLIVEYFLAYCFWPVVVSKITGVINKDTGKKIPGWIISIPMTASKMMRSKNIANKQIKKAMKLAEKMGARNVGLGALTSSLTKGGLDLESVFKREVAITNGKLYTAKIVTDIVIDSAHALKIKRENALIAVVGAAGSIGSASVQILSKKGFRNFMLIDLSNRKNKIENIKKTIEKLGSNVSATIHSSLDSLIKADIIITATNRPDALIRSDNVKPGAIIVDDAQPSDIDVEIFKSRNDVLVLEGGVVHTSNINMNFHMGLKHKTDIFSCLAEVIILSYLGNKKQFIGEVTEVNFEELKKLNKYSKELGFKRGHFQNMYKKYSQEDIEYILTNKV